MRFGKITFSPPSRLIGKNELVTEGFLEVAEALQAFIPLCNGPLNSDKLESGRHCVLGTVSQVENASVWVQDPKEGVFLGKG